MAHRKRACLAVAGALVTAAVCGGIWSLGASPCRTTARTGITVGGKPVTDGRWESVITDRQTRSVSRTYEDGEGHVGTARATQVRTRTRTQRYEDGMKVGDVTVSEWGSWEPAEGDWKMGNQRMSILKSQYGYKAVDEPSYGSVSTIKADTQDFRRW